jgi:hypothetical protein
MPGASSRSQPDPRRDRVRAQLWHILAGRLDVHGGHGHPGRVQQPGRCLLPVAVNRQRISGRRVQQSHQLPLGTPDSQPQRHRPVTGVVGEHDEVVAVHVTAVQHPSVRPGLSNHDAHNRHGGPPAGGKTATRPTLLSVRRPATGYPPVADQGTGSAGANPQDGMARIGEAGPGVPGCLRHRFQKIVVTKPDS